MENLINLTPHDINIVNEEGNKIFTIPKEDGPYPRLVEDVEVVGTISGVEIVRKTYGRCENLPDPKDGVYYIVSGLIASAMRRKDLLVPNTVRDKKGQIMGCNSFGII